MARLLDNTKQRVVLNGLKSLWGNVEAGVSKGSTLGLYIPQKNVPLIWMYPMFPHIQIVLTIKISIE